VPKSAEFPFPLVKPFIEFGYAPCVVNGTVYYATIGTTLNTDYALVRRPVKEAALQEEL